jgi:hypothetical protein
VKRTPAAPAALTATAATALFLLTACGGGGGGHPHDKITGAADTTTSPSPTATPSASPVADGKAPTFHLTGVTVDLSGFDGGSDKESPVLRDSGYAIKSLLEVQVQDKDTANFQRYFNGLQVAQFGDSLIKWAKKKTITGTFAYYDPSVKFQPGGAAQVSYCESQRKGYAKVRATGKVLVTQPSLGDFNRWTLLFSKNARTGDWQAGTYRIVNKARECETS